MEEWGSENGKFSAEIGEFEVKKVEKFDWVWKVGFGGSLDTMPLIFKGMVYVGCFDHNLYAIDKETGELVWKFAAQKAIGESAPVEYKGKIYFGSHDYNLYCLDALSGKFLWKFRAMGEIGGTVTVGAGTVYFGSRDQNLYAVDAETGSLRWKFRTRDEILARPLVYGNKVYCGSFDHNIYCLDSTTGELVWKHETQQEIYGVEKLTVRNGVVFAPSIDNNLRALDAETGELRWKLTLGTHGLAASPVIYKDILYQQSRDGILYAITPEGRILWKFVNKEQVAIPWIADDRIYVGSADHNLYCLDIDGKVVWKFATEGPVWWGCIVHEGVVYFTSWDCHLYAADAKTGRLIWKFRTNAGPSSLPPVTESFEVRMKIPESEKEEKRKSYELDIGGDGEEIGSFYKARVTYQMKTQYASKGKYQKDSDEEEF